MLGLQEFPSTWMVFFVDWWHEFPQIIGVSNDHLGSAWWIAISCLELSTGLYTYLIATPMHNCSWCTAQVLHWVIGENMAIEQRVDLSRGNLPMGRSRSFPPSLGAGGRAARRRQERGMVDGRRLLRATMPQGGYQVPEWLGLGWLWKNPLAVSGFWRDDNTPSFVGIIMHHYKHPY